jgi:hypothetical protein
MPSPLFRSASFILPAAFLSFLAARLCRGQGKADMEARLEELSSQAQAGGLPPVQPIINAASTKIYAALKKWGYEDPLYYYCVIK